MAPISGDPKSKFLRAQNFSKLMRRGKGIRIIKKRKLTKLLLSFNGFINFNDEILELIQKRSEHKKDKRSITISEIYLGLFHGLDLFF